MTESQKGGLVGGRSVSDPNSNPKITSGEFPTAWHREKYIEGLKREVEAGLLREWDEKVAAARAELVRLGVEKKHAAARRKAGA